MFHMSYNIRAFKAYNMKKTNKQTNKQTYCMFLANFEFLKMAPFSTSSVWFYDSLQQLQLIVSLRRRNDIQLSLTRSTGIICQQFGQEFYATYREQCTLSQTCFCFFPCEHEKNWDKFRIVAWFALSTKLKVLPKSKYYWWNFFEIT